MRPRVALAVVVYAVLMVLLWQGMQATRTRILDSLATPEAQADWDAWRAAAARQAAGDGPVQRRVPKADEPPALMLVRDYFGVCLAGAWLFTTALFVATVYLVGGMLSDGRS